MSIQAGILAQNQSLPSVPLEPPAENEENASPIICLGVSGLGLMILGAAVWSSVLVISPHKEKVLGPVLTISGLLITALAIRALRTLDNSEPIQGVRQEDIPMDEPGDP